MNFFWRKKHKIGLALGSGAARGLAHIGAINALREGGVKVDMIAGSSIGALVGACFAQGSLKKLEEIALSMDLKKLLKLVDLNPFLLSKGFVTGKKVEEFLKNIIGDAEFKDLNIPLIVTATDAETGEEIIIKTGPVVKALRASLSIPAVFTPAKFENRLLIDAGIASPMPVDILKREGMNFIIASNVVKKPQIHIKSENKSTSKKFMDIFKENEEQENLPFMFETVITAIDIMGYQIVKLKLKDANFVISPEINHIALLEFYRAREAIEAGYKEAKKSMFRYKLKKYLRLT